MGLTLVYEGHVRDDLASGALVEVLEAFSTPCPGYSLYYPQRRHASPALRAFVEYLRRTKRRQAPGGGSARCSDDGEPSPLEADPGRAGSPAREATR